jgi:hypothetical protein
MPKGSPKAQTIASDKYQKKAGYTVKSFKIKKDVADAYIEACEKAGVSQASQITKLMLEFIEKHQ